MADIKDLEKKKFAADSNGDVAVKVAYGTEGSGTLPEDIRDLEFQKFVVDIDGNVSLRVIGSGGGGSQTPWTSDIDGGGYSLSNVENITLNPDLGTELVPELTGVSGVNWTYGSGFTSPLNGSAVKTRNGSTFVAVTGTPTINIPYKVTIVITDWTVGSTNLYLGGVIVKNSTGSTAVINGNGTWVGYVTPTATTKFTIVSEATSRYTISSISVKPITTTTGKVTAYSFVKDPGKSTEFLKADGSTSGVGPLTENLDANNKSITNIQGAQLKTVEGYSGVTLYGNYDGFSYGLKVFDAGTGTYWRVHGETKEHTVPTEGMVFQYDSNTQVFYPALLNIPTSLWETDVDTGAVRNTNSAVGYPYSTQLGHNLGVVNQGEFAYGLVSDTYGKGNAGASHLTMECKSQTSNVGLFTITDTYYEINILPGFTYALEIDVVMVMSDGTTTNRWKLIATVQNTGAVVSGVGPIGQQGNATDSTWYNDGSGGSDIPAMYPNEDSSTYLRLDTNSSSNLVRLYLATAQEGFKAYADVKIVKLKQQAAGGSSGGAIGPYFGMFFAQDANANGFYADTGTTENGYPLYYNGIYWLAFDGSYWIIRDYMYTTISYGYNGKTGQYYNATLPQWDGFISDTTTIYTGTGFSDSVANGGYWDSGNSVNGYPIYTNGTYRISWDLTYWNVLDSFGTTLFQSYGTAGYPNGQYYIPGFGATDGYLN